MSAARHRSHLAPRSERPGLRLWRARWRVKRRRERRPRVPTRTRRRSSPRACERRRRRRSARVLTSARRRPSSPPPTPSLHDRPPIRPRAKRCSRALPLRLSRPHVPPRRPRARPTRARPPPSARREPSLLAESSRSHTARPETSVDATRRPPRGGKRPRGTPPPRLRRRVSFGRGSRGGALSRLARRGLPSTERANLRQLARRVHRRRRRRQRVSRLRASRRPRARRPRAVHAPRRARRDMGARLADGRQLLLPHGHGEHGFRHGGPLRRRTR